MSEGAAFVEVVATDALKRHDAAWRALAERAAEPNVFAEPAFLAPAMRRLAGSRRLTTLLVWGGPSRAALIGLVVLREPSLGLGLARIWRSEQAGLAAMLFDRDAIGEALAAIVAWSRRARSRIAGIRWPAIEASGPLALALRSLSKRDSLRLETDDARRRAALIVDGMARFEESLDKKRRKEWARLGRRLAERGRLESCLLDDVDAIERFLRLEGRGWKGARGTALAAEPARRKFAGEMLGAFSELRRLQIHELTLDGEPIAMGVVLPAGARAFYWKTAYDERWAEFSPGVLLTLALSRRLAREPGLALVDSCALPDHPMIDRLWLGRIELVDIALAIAPQGARRFGAWLAAERAALAARERLKGVVNRLRGRKR